MGDLDHVVDIDKNLFINVLHADTDNDDVDEIVSHSPYYDIDNFISTLTQNNKCFSILSTNIQCIRVKFDEVNISIEHLRTLNFEFSAICPQESCISDNDNLRQIELKGYKLIRQGKYQLTSKGGLVIYCHEKIYYEYKFKLNKYKTWEGQINQVKKGDNVAKPIIIGNIYRPPNELVDSYNEFISELSPVLKSLEKNKSEVIVSGNFNNRPS